MAAAKTPEESKQAESLMSQLIKLAAEAQRQKNAGNILNHAHLALDGTFPQQVEYLLDRLEVADMYEDLCR